MAARLDGQFGLLTGGSRAALPRQQTLRATLDWSYDLYERWQTTAREVLGADAADTAWAEGQAMSLDEAFAYALASENADNEPIVASNHLTDAGAPRTHQPADR